MVPRPAQIAYCEEEFECRRIMLLVHFGETFTAAQCKATCDTCLHSAAQAHDMCDMTAAAKDVIKARACCAVPLMSGLDELHPPAAPAAGQQAAPCCGAAAHAIRWRCLVTCGCCFCRIRDRLWTPQARVAASAACLQVVAAVGGASSLNHVVDVYRGATNAAVRNKRHDCLPEHGLGKSLTCALPGPTAAHAPVSSCSVRLPWQDQACASLPDGAGHASAPGLGCCFRRCRLLGAAHTSCHVKAESFRTGLQPEPFAPEQNAAPHAL